MTRVVSSETKTFFRQSAAHAHTATLVEDAEQEHTTTSETSSLQTQDALLIQSIGRIYEFASMPWMFKYR